MTKQSLPQNVLMFDIIYAQPPTEVTLMRALGQVAQMFDFIEPDDKLEEQMPRRRLMKTGELRLLIIQSMGASLLDTTDLRPLQQFLVQLVHASGGRLGTVGALGEREFFGAVAKERSDLLRLALIDWLSRDELGLDFRPTNQTNAADYDKKRDNLPIVERELLALKTEEQLSGLMPVGPYWMVDTLGPMGTKRYHEEYDQWMRRSFQIFQNLLTPKQAPPPPPPVPETPKVPVELKSVGFGAVLWIPKERFGLSLFDGIVKGRPEVFHKSDSLPGQVLDFVAKKKLSFLAELPSLGELFYEGKILDRAMVARLERPISGVDGATQFVAHMPRFGKVQVVQKNGRYAISPEQERPSAAELVGLLG